MELSQKRKKGDRQKKANKRKVAIYEGALRNHCCGHLCFALIWTIMKKSSFRFLGRNLIFLIKISKIYNFENLFIFIKKMLIQLIVDSKLSVFSSSFLSELFFLRTTASILSCLISLLISWSLFFSNELFNSNGDDDILSLFERLTWFWISLTFWSKHAPFSSTNH